MEAKEREPDRLAIFDGLPPEEEPSPALEQRVVAALREQGLLRPPGRLKVVPRLAAALAAGAVLLAAGWLAGSILGGTIPSPGAAPSTAIPQPTHALLLHAGDGYRAAPTPAAARRRVDEYRAWARHESRAGRLTGGYKLVHDAEVVSAGGGSSSAGDIQGLFLIVAQDMNAAVAVARGCPHVLYGGAVEVRAIDGS